MRYLLIVCLLFIFSVESKPQTNFYQRLADSAITLSKQSVQYDLSYFSIAYPNGDVPKHKGVCTDVVIRAYRKLNIDLQKEVHEDMRQQFHLYPKYWGLRTTDRNIDHRRVPNLMVYFKRHGTVLPITQNPTDFKPGDIICWALARGMKHIGLVVHRKSTDQKRFLVIHNIGDGQVVEDALFAFPIIGHYRYGGVRGER